MAWYSNSDCQKKHWLIHLVDCNLDRPITTADRLVASIHSRILPVDEETRRDFGFTQAASFESHRMMFDVYNTLIVDLQVKANTIRQWMTEGVLGTMIQETFDARLSSEERRKSVYVWFREHQSTFGRDTNPGSVSDVRCLEGIHEAWKYMGRDPNDSLETVNEVLLHLTADQHACFRLVSLVSARMRPAPVGPYRRDAPYTWVSFGFCACEDQFVEDSLLTSYIQLISLVDWDTLCHAYTTSSLPKLFADHNMVLGHPLILDVLHSRNYKSVWHLKAFVIAEDERARTTQAHPAIGIDYGFFNCQNVDEVLVLRNAYKQVLMRAGADPLALHEACIRGQLFEYVRQLARLKPPHLFKRLMANPYPRVSMKNYAFLEWH